MSISLKGLAREVALVTGHDPEVVHVICLALMRRVQDHVDNGREVSLRGLGTFRWVHAKARSFNYPGMGVVEFPEGKRLVFKISRAMTRRLGMEKFGVEVNKELVKTAKEKGEGTCPWCGEALDENGFCPTHGSEPFEKTHEDDK